MGWCFATINGRLAEIYFKDRAGKFRVKEITGYCYVKKSERIKKDFREGNYYVWDKVKSKLVKNRKPKK